MVRTASLPPHRLSPRPDVGGSRSAVASTGSTTRSSAFHPATVSPIPSMNFSRSSAVAPLYGMVRAFRNENPSRSATLGAVLGLHATSNVSRTRPAGIIWFQPPRSKPLSPGALSRSSYGALLLRRHVPRPARTLSVFPGVHALALHAVQPPGYNAWMFSHCVGYLLKRAAAFPRLGRLRWTCPVSPACASPPARPGTRRAGTPLSRVPPWAWRSNVCGGDLSISVVHLFAFFTASTTRTAPGEITPAEKAGTDIRGPDKSTTLMQKAAMSDTVLPRPRRTESKNTARAAAA